MKPIVDQTSRYIVTLIHIGFWILFFIFPFLLSTTPNYGSFNVMESLIYTAVLALFFYANTLVLIPKLLGRKKVNLYILSILLIIAAIVGLRVFVEYQLNSEMFEKSWFLGKIITDSIFSSLIVITVGGGLKITKEWFKNERLKKEIESEKLVAELALMKSQINPHFLFNTLNNIRSLVRKNSPNSDAAIIKLSQLMRYMLYDAANDYVPLEKEIEYLKNYIDLQRLRLPEKVDIQFEIIENQKGHQIQPMLFIPFVENAFKHGVSYLEDSKVQLKLVVEKNELHFSIWNNMNIRKDEQQHMKTEERAGFGLKNIQQRLEYLYPDEHELKINTEHGIFSVDLWIKRLVKAQ